MANDKPFTVEEQIDTMKKYVTLTKRARMRDFLQYSGYFRASRYGKYLLSYTNVFAMKPSQDVLFALYQFDFELRKVMYEACAKAEIQIKSAIANAVSLKTGDAVFYLEQQNYTPTRSERNKFYRKKNVKFFNSFFSDIQDKEEMLRKDVLKYPETSVYKGYKQDKIEMRGDRAEMSDFPLYLNTVAGGLDRRDQTIGGFSFVVKIYAVPVVEIIG